MKEKPFLTRREILFLAGISVGSLLLLSGKDRVDGLLSKITTTPKTSKDEIPQPQVISELTPTPESPSRLVQIILAGDVMLGRSVMTVSLDKGDPAYSFRKVGETLREADIVFANLENPILPECQRTDEGMRLCAEPKMAEALTFAGVDVVNLANNHSLDYGQEGLSETQRILAERGIEVAGAGGLKEIKIGETTFGFLGFNFVSREITESDLELVRESSQISDVLIVMVHWGKEYSSQASSFQRETARRLVDAGADVIVGNHPHVVQEREEIDGKPVFYSLGNLVFDQSFPVTQPGLVVKLTFERDRLVSTEELPTYMSSWVQPEFVAP